MVFASLEFLGFFLPAFLLVYVVTPKPARNAVLLAASWLFYGWWNPEFLLLFVGLTFLAWASGIAVEKTRSSAPGGKVLIVTLIVFNLGVLGWFKYANIVVSTWSSVASQCCGVAPPEWTRIALPIALSFTVLQIVSYLVDIRRGRFPAERRPIDFAAYLAMFGHLVAGPIIRYDWIRRRLAHRPFHWRSFGAGARRFMTGLVMKVLVADTLSPLVDQAFAATHPSLADAWLGNLGYTLQLYFDFAGYSAMAVGIGAMLGFRFPQNFRTPYLARDLSDFWRRWHISLSSWLRDYLYIALGGSRGGGVRTAVNLIITMAIGGLWHGADSWNYLYWGIAHGVGLAVVHTWKRHGRPLPALLAHLLTLSFFMLGLTVFRTPDLASAYDMLAGQFGQHGFAISAQIDNLLRVPVLLAYGLGIGWVLAPLLRQRWPMRAVCRTGAGPTVALAGSIVLVVAFLLSCSLIASRSTVPFLYFQF